MSFIKEVILSFKGEVKGDGLQQVKSQLRDIDKTGDKTFSKIQKNLKNYEKSLEEASKVKLDINGIDSLIKKLTATQKEAKKLDKDFVNLSEDQQKAVIKVNQAIEEQIKVLNRQRSEIIKTGQAQKITTREFSNSINSLLPLLGRYGTAIQGSVNSINEYVNASGKAARSSTQLGSAVSLLRNPYVALGATITAAVLAPLSAFFTSTSEGQEKIKSFGLSLGFLADQVKSSFADIGRGILNLDFNQIKAGINDLKANLSDVGKIARDSVADFQIQASKTIRDNELIIAKSEVTIAQERLTLAEAATTLGEITNKRKALSKAREVDAQNDELEIANAKLRRDSFEKELSLRKNITSEDKQRLNNLDIELEKTKAKAELGDLIFIKNQKNINREEGALKDEFDSILGSINKLIDEVGFNVNIGDLLKFNIEDPIEVRRKLREITLIFEEIAAQTKQLREQGLKGFDVPQTTRDNLKKLNDDLLEIYNTVKNTKFNIEFDPLTRQPNEVNLDLKINTNTFKRPLKNAGTDIEEFKKRIDEIANSLPDIFGGISEFENIENQKTDILIEQAQLRVDELQKIAASGNAEQLQLEESRLNELLQKREAAARRQAQIDAIEKLSTTGLAVAKFVSGAAGAFATNPFAAIIEIGALIGSVLAGVSALKNAGGLYEGDEYITKSSGKGAKRHPKDTIPIFAAEGERMIPIEINRQLKGIPNELLPELARNYRKNIFKINTINGGSIADAATLQAIKEQNEIMNETRKAINDIRINVGFDGEQFYVKQRQKSRQSRRVNSLKR